MPMTRCGAEIKRLTDISNQDIQVIEDTLAERLGLGVTQVEAEKQAVDEAIAQLQAEKQTIMQAVAAQYPQQTQQAAETVSRRSFIIGTAAALAASDASAGVTVGRAKPISAAVMDQKVSPAVEKLLRDGQADGTTSLDGAAALRRALGEIAANGPAGLRALAREIERILPTAGVMLTIDGKRLMNAHGAVTLAPMPHLQLFTAKGRTGLTYSTLLHEALHLAVAARYRDLSTGVMRSNDAVLKRAAPAASAQLQQLTDLWEEFRNLPRYTGNDVDLNLSLRESAGDIDEFFVRALTDPKLQEYLATKEYQGKTLMQRFKDWVKSLFFGLGREGTAPSWLDAILAASSDLTSAMTKDAADFSMLQAVNNFDNTKKSVLYSAANPSPQAAAGRDMLRSAPGLGTFRQWVSDKVFDFQQQPWIGGLFTNSQLGELYKNLPAVRKINEAMRRMSQVANRYMTQVHKIDLGWRALQDDQSLELSKMMLETTMAKTHVAVDRVLKTAWEDASNNHLDRNDPAVRAKFEELHRRYWAMLPAQRKVYGDVHEQLRQQRDARVALVQAEIVRAYGADLGQSLTPEQAEILRKSESALAATQTAGFPKISGAGRLRALTRLRGDLIEHRQEFSTMNGPYFPLVRFGEHVVVSKSTTIADAEAKVLEMRLKLKALYADAGEENAEGTEVQVNELRKQIAGQQAIIDKAKKSDRDYSVQFFERPSDARRAAEQAKLANPDHTTYHTLREEYYRGLDSVTPAFFDKVQQVLSASLDAGATPMDPRAKADVISSLRDMYLTRSPENAALKSELKRQGIDGVKAGEMRRGFAAQTMSGAWRISRLTHGHEIVTGMNDLAGDKSLDARSILNEYKKRMAQAMTSPKPNSFLSTVSNVSHFMYLGLSPAYFLTNMSQTWVTAMPIIAGRFGMGRSSSALARASKDVIPMLINAARKGVKENGMVGLTLDLDIDNVAKELKLTDGEIRLLKALTDNGALDISMRHDVGSQASGETGNIMSKALEISSVITNYPEVYNRLTTALAAYRLQMEDSHDQTDREKAHQDAVAYTDKIIDNTHLNYSEENAPRFMRGNLQRVVFQFKRYMQGMLWLIGKTVRDMYAGESEADRKEARNAFAYLMTTNMAVAGTAGLPIAAPLAFVAKMVSAMWPDDDEPEVTQMIYNGLKDTLGETAARAMVKGLPTLANMDVSGSIGLGNIMNPVAFARTDGKDTFSQEWWAQIALSLAGPGAGLAAKWGQAGVDALNGDTAKAAAGALPRFAANPVRAFERAAEGVTSKRGDILIDPSEFNLPGLALKALGFESAAVSDMYDTRNAFNNMVQNRKEARNTLLREYVKARNNGEGMSELQDAVMAFNERHPDDPIKQANLLASYKQHLAQVREMRGGVRVDKRTAGIAEELGIN